MSNSYFETVGGARLAAVLTRELPIITKELKAIRKLLEEKGDGNEKATSKNETL